MFGKYSVLQVLSKSRSTAVKKKSLVFQEMM